MGGFEAIAPPMSCQLLELPHESIAKVMVVACLVVLALFSDCIVLPASGGVYYHTSDRQT